ncbi:hypothetical protein LCGC14_0425680 [marine sediment metagenome]|uniref:Uncharacterized protein n=1 Tax=marine sediment metagenome TaxID=412755 RepID=A0A0F9VBP2_9ZZZZ
MAVGYLKENFAFGTLASTLNAAAVTLTVTAGHSLPTAAGTFQLVIWDAVSFPNASGDLNVEIVAASFDTGNVYNITRAQESTSDVEHAAGQKVGLHYTAAVNVDDLDAANHPMARISGSTFSTVQHAQDIFHSAGWISGGVVSDDADGTITVAAGTGLIRATDSATAQILYFDWASEAGANVALADNDINYVYIEYNGGSPQAVATTTVRTDFNTNVLLASISREGTVLHINQTDQHTVGDHANSMIRRMVGVQPYGHVSGGILSETGTRNIALTAGTFWRGLTEFSTGAVDTQGADTFSYYYNDGSWQKVSSVSDIHQSNYNNFGVGLATLANNRYGVHWVYLQADSDDVAVIYGIGSYTLSQAEDVQPPSAVPLVVEVEGILAGKIIIGKDDAAFTQVESAFQTKFSGSLATDHADLVSLDYASAGHTGFQAQGDVLDDFNTLTAPTVDGQFIVATGAGAFAYESTTIARTSLGVGEADTPLLGGVIIADGGTIGQAAGPLITFNDTNNDLKISGCKVGIGTTISNAPLEVKGAKPAGNIGGHQSGMLHVTGDGTSEFSSSVITGHSAYNGNTQLWYLGSTTTGNDNIAFINRQNAPIEFYTNNTLKMTIDAAGTIVIPGVIELGHDTDTTIARASAGDLNIEGNLIYRVGGTDVAIADGGSGQGTAQLAINALSAVAGGTNEHVLTKDTGTGNAIWKVSAAAADGKVKVDVAATADYLGAANSDGALRTGAGLTYTDGGDFVTLTTDLVGDATAGRVIRFARVVLQDGTNANTLKAQMFDTWNGDDIAEVNNIVKGATTSGWTLDAGGTILTIEASGLTGNALAALGSIRVNASGNDTLQIELLITANDIQIFFYDDAAAQDMTVLLDTGPLTFNMFYITDA